MLSIRIHSITEWHSLFPASYSRTFNSVPIVFNFRFHLPDIQAKIRSFHVPHFCQTDDLGLPSTPAVQHLRMGSYETHNLTTYLLVQA